MSTVKKSRSGKYVACLKVSLVEKSRGQLGPRVTVSALPDDVLLEIFDFYLVGPFSEVWHENVWMTLAWVCKKWRCIVLASPQRLRLQLLCTNDTPVQNLLDEWPELPLVVEGFPGLYNPREGNNIFAALKQYNRVCKIQLCISNTFLKNIRAMEMRDPFPVLTPLSLWSWNDNINAPSIPDSFLGGSAPRLQTLRLDHVSFLALPELLFSTRDLVDLQIVNVPLSGIISPEAMVTYLSTLARLQTLRLGFRSPRSREHRENRLPPRPTRSVLPALTEFFFKGDSEYLEDIVSHIDTPPLHRLEIRFFNQLIFDTPLLRHFISRTETVKLLHQADMIFHTGHVRCNLARKEENGEKTRTLLSSLILCSPSDWQLSSLAQICDSVWSPLPTVDCLKIRSERYYWEDDMDNTQWLEVLTPFTSVKDLVLDWDLTRLVPFALEDLTGERVTEVLPALQNLFLEGHQRSKSVKKAIGKFIAARQLSGRPVTVHHRDGSYQDYRPWEADN